MSRKEATTNFGRAPRWDRSWVERKSALDILQPVERVADNPADPERYLQRHDVYYWRTQRAHTEQTVLLQYVGAPAANWQAEGHYAIRAVAGAANLPR